MDLSEFDGLSNFRQPSAVANNGQNLIDTSNNGHDNDIDQIIDLSINLSANGHGDDDGVPVPIIAFEETRITSPKEEVSTAAGTKRFINLGWVIFLRIEWILNLGKEGKTLLITEVPKKA